jgi:two-component system response regulator
MNRTFDSEVLLIEDNPNDAELTMRAVKKQGLGTKILHLKDGEEAMNFLFDDRQQANQKNIANVKVIFLDLKLPKIMGLEVLKVIKGNPQTAHIPVIILSSSREDNDINTAYRYGVNGYIVKPVIYEDYADAIQNAARFWLFINETIRT